MERPRIDHVSTEGRQTSSLYVGRFRGSPLGNPFRITREQDRTAALERYRYWLWKHLQAYNKDVLDELDKITLDTVLLCHCHPLPCHADVISKAWKWLQEARDKGQYPGPYVTVTIQEWDRKQRRFVDEDISYPSYLNKPQIDARH